MPSANILIMLQLLGDIQPPRAFGVWVDEIMSCCGGGAECTDLGGNRLLPQQHRTCLPSNSITAAERTREFEALRMAMERFVGYSGFGSLIER